MPNAISSFKNGSGLLYICDIDNNILSNLSNDAEGGLSVQADALTSGALSSELSARSVIAFSVNGTVTGLSVNAVPIITGTIAAAGTLALTLAAVRDNINSFVTTPDYFAFSDATTLIIYANAGAGSAINGAVVAITGTITYAAPPVMSGGTDPGAITDPVYGRRYWLNEDAGAVQGTLSGASEITKYLIMQGLQSHYDQQSLVITDNTLGILNVVRNNVTTIVNADTFGAAASGTLRNISTDGFNDGDLIFLRGTAIGKVVTLANYTSGNDNIMLANDTAFSTASSGEVKKGVIALQFFNIAGVGQRWVEVSRSPSITLTVSSFRAAGLAFPAQGVDTRAITNAGGTITLVPGTDKEYQLITGSATLLASYNFTFGGTPKDGDRFHFKYAATMTVGANTITIGGITLTTTQALEGNVWVESFYDIDSTSWKSFLYLSADGQDLVNTTDLATKEDDLGLPGSDGQVLSSTALGVRSWVNPSDITGPGLSTNNAIVRWDGVTGTAIQDYTSGAPTISDIGAVVIPLSTGISLAVDTDVLVVDATNNRIGMNTATPSSTLHVAGGFTLADGSQGANMTLVSDANGLASWELRSGEYTPAVVSVGNAVVGLIYPFNYLRVGNVVHVSGYFSIDAADPGPTQVSVSLPIASDLQNFHDLVGVGAITSTDVNSLASDCAAVEALAGSDLALVKYYDTTGLSKFVHVVFQYNII